MVDNPISEKITHQLLPIVRRFLFESGSERAARMVSVESLLEKDLGIGSLERAELFHRIEKTFGIQLADSLMVEANTVGDLVMAVSAAKPITVSRPTTAVHALEPHDTDPSMAQHFVDVIRLYQENEPKRPHIYLQDDAGHEEIIDYGSLVEWAEKVAQGLVKRGLKSGETVAIMLPTSAEFFYAFVGILLAGGIPVPIYPPFRADQIEEYAKREAMILRNAGVRVLITFQRAETLSKLLQVFVPSLLEVTTVQALMTTGIPLPELTLESSDPALIQYTSGSTGNPKGVLLSHQSLLANVRAYGEAIRVQPTDVAVSWLPLYHDMGLIGSWLGSLYYGVPLTLLSPLTFLSRPESWLWAIHYHRATVSAGPNFAYELCVRKIEDEDIEGLDLSSWRLAFNGAEAVYPKTLERFTKRFSAYGFDRHSFYPVYGLAECALALTFPAERRTPRIDRIARDTFEKENRALPVSHSDNGYYEFVACGKPLTGYDVRIVDDQITPLGEREIGNIQFKGPSAMLGYYRNPEATKAIFYDGWWDTGDRGYLAEGELFITGRKKDLIIKGGRNYYPAEIEDIASQAQGIRKGCVVSFGVTDAERGTEKLVVVAETSVDDKKRYKAIRAEVVDKIVSQLGIPPDEVLLVPPRTIPKTSSGKLRRADCKKSYLEKKLGQRTISVRLQMAKLFFSSGLRQFTTGLMDLGKSIYSGYLLVMATVTLLPTWLAVVVLPRKKASQVFRLWARSIFYWGFCPLTVKGQSHLDKKQPMIFVANHTSYMDVLVLAGILPADACFVGKKELFTVFLFRSFMQRLGYLTVDRMDFSKSESEIQRMNHILAEGRSLIIFPEGTFSYATGVRPFKSGAFKIAAETGYAICPVAIRGARKILRANHRLLKPAAIEVIIGDPILPQGKDWAEVMRLREMARLVIAKHSGEHTIDLVLAGLPSSQPFSSDSSS